MKEKKCPQCDFTRRTTKAPEIKYETAHVTEECVICTKFASTI